MFKKSHHKSSARAFTPARPAQNTFSKHTNKKVKSDNPRNGQKHTFSSKPQTRSNVRKNDKKFSCQCQCKRIQRTSNTQDFRVNSNLFKSSHNYSQSHKTPKNFKHPGLGLKVDLKPVPATSHHASINTSYVTSGSKLTWVPKLTT